MIYTVLYHTEREVDTKELPLITQLKWMPPQSAYRFELRKIQHQLNVII